MDSRPVGGVGQAETVEEFARTGRRVTDAVQPCEQPQVLPPGEVAVHRRVLPGHPDRPPDRARLPYEVVARDPRGARVRPQQRGQQPYGRRLARPVRAEHPDHRALRHGQIEAAHGVDVPETLLQTLTKYSVRSSHGSTIAHYVRCT